MKLACSNIACGDLDFATLLAKSQEWGYAGVEIKVLDGRFDLTSAPSLRRDPEALRKQLAEHGQTLVALNTSLSFFQNSSAKLAEAKQKVREHIELAGSIGALNVIVCGDVLPSGMSLSTALEQTGAALRELAVVAAEHEVTLLIENIGDFASSRVAWMLHDAVRFPSLRVCWNQVHAQMLNEPPSLTIPRMGVSLGLVRVSDARFTDSGLVDAYVEVGKGQVGTERMIELLKGIAYDGWLCVDWPRLWQPGLAPAEKVLPNAAKYLTEQLERKPIVLSAYKGDKNAPKFVSREEPAAAAES